MLCTSIICFGNSKKAKKTEPIFQRHIISVSVTNGVSDAFYNGMHGPTRFVIVAPDPSTGYNHVDIYKPGYAFAGNVKYSFGVSQLLRIETGIGYTLQELIYFQGEKNPNAPYNYGSGFIYTYYKGSFTIPIHAVLKEHLKKGWLSIKLGPNFIMPINDFYSTDNPNIPLRSWHNHYTYNVADMSENASLGFDLKIGYEIQMSRTSTVEIGPLCNFTNLVLFHRDIYNTSMINGRQLFRYYAGLDVAFNFGLKKVKEEKAKHQSWSK